MIVIKATFQPTRNSIFWIEHLSYFKGGTKGFVWCLFFKSLKTRNHQHKSPFIALEHIWICNCFRMNFKLSSGNILKLLKALVFKTMGKTDEALWLPLCLNSKDACLVDDITLSTFQIVFQRLDCSDLATSYYEYACGKIPNNLGLLMGLFNYYMHQYSYV